MLRGAASVAEPFYKAGVRGRNAAFDRGWRSVHRAGLPVISVGNLTAGGTGKTPMVIAVARMLERLGYPPAVLLRGYRGEGPTGSDEGALLGHHLPGVPIVAAGDRVAAARSVRREHPEVRAIVLDDGFQHRRLHRDLDLVLIDATDPFGFDRVLPRGLLREPAEGLRRADAVIVTHSDQLGDERTGRELAARIEGYHGGPSIAWCEHRWSAVLDEADRAVEMKGATVLPFCGIGNPGAFFRQAGQRFRVVEPRAFADHHPYRAAELREMARRAEERGADALLTTEKDWVRLRAVVESSGPRVPIWRPVLQMFVASGGEALEQRVREALGANAPR